MPKPVNLIVACAENRVIGRAGRLPWRIPDDWEFFRRQTAGQIAIVGRVSFESWKSALTDNRRAIVVTHRPLAATRQPEDALPPEDAGPISAPSLSAALALAETLPGEIYVCGGQRIFEEAIALPQAARLYLTLVHTHADGDRFFPVWREIFTRVIEQREGADENHRYTFYVLER